MKQLATYYVFDKANTALAKVSKPIPPLKDGEILVTYAIPLFVVVIFIPIVGCETNHVLRF